MADIHATAIVSPEAQLGEGVKIGPYCTVGAHVKLGDRTELMSHVVIDGFTALGSDCRIYPFASLGLQTQDLKYDGGRPGVEIGDKNTIREYVTINAATYDGDFTRIGSECHIMAYSHIAHDCLVGDEVIIANAGTLAGHVIIEDQAIIGGLCGIHQFVRIGKQSITGGCSKVTMDIPPFMMADGNPLAVRGINSIGLKRRGLDESVQKSIKKAFKIIYKEGHALKEAARVLSDELESSPEMDHLVRFLETSERGITR